jgi:hypothetical protein
MADFQQELQNRQLTWSRFIRASFWTAGGTAVLFILMWIFLV